MRYTIILLAALIVCIADAVPRQPRRIVAVGDFHGDLPNVHKVLRMAGLVDKYLQWTGGANTDFVQTGDVVDRGPDTIPLFQLLARLHNESLSSQHGVYPLLGNHEIMNLSNDWRSVTAPEIATFGNESARAHAWSARGWIGALLRHTLNNVTLALDGTVFVHGGITVEWARLGVDEINARARKALLREEWGNAVFERPRGPLWYRGYALEEEEEVCTELKAALALLSAKRMVIGHTPQLATGEILSRCDGRVFVIDVGITTRYGGNCAALEIVEDTVTALYCIDDKPEEARRVDMTPRQGHGEL